jgi:hypothetical protein
MEPLRRKVLRSASSSRSGSSGSQTTIPAGNSNSNCDSNNNNKNNDPRPCGDNNNDDNNDYHDNAAGASVTTCTPTLLFNPNKWSLWLRNRKWIFWKWFCRLFVALYLVLQLVLYLRVYFMSRPAWIYGGKNIQHQQVHQCLFSDSSSVTATGRTLLKQAPSPRVFWEWQRYSRNTATNNNNNNNNSSTSRPLRKLLIAQYSGFGKYSELLDAVAPVNKAYARKWGHDVVILQGTSLYLPRVDETCSPSGPRATFNKLALLELALGLNKNATIAAAGTSSSYDQLLILDTDAMIVDFDTDITTLLPDDYMMAAHRVWSMDSQTTWDINAGITLWNLHHPHTQRVFDEWNRACHEEVEQVLVSNDDQFFLQKTLLDLGKHAERKVWSLAEEFYYQRATVVKHFKRESRSWVDTGLQGRLEQIHSAVNDVCQQWADCQESPLVKYSDRDG